MGELLHLSLKSSLLRQERLNPLFQGIQLCLILGLATLPSQCFLQKQKDQYTTRSTTKSTRGIRLLTYSSLKACSTFSRGKSLPDVTWEVLATTTAFLGTSSIVPTVFPVFWESTGRTCYLITLRANKRIPFYKALQAYL